MALQLMDPIYNEMPFFQPNQVLTYDHLNDLVKYLSQQERFTRNKLIGSGIVCGLTFNWVSSGQNAKVVIQDGCAITSGGYLAVFKQPDELIYKREFSRLKKYPPFENTQVYNGETIYELITKAQYDAESESVKSDLLDSDKTGKALILLLEPEIKNPAKCLDENCDDKGKVYLYTPRPLLVPKSVLDKILDANNQAKYFTEEGRGWKGTNSRLNDNNIDFISVPSLFTYNAFDSIDSGAKLQELFKNKVTDALLESMKLRIDTTLNSYPWIFKAGSEVLKTEIPVLVALSLGEYLKTKAISFRDRAPDINNSNKNHIQYLYDFIRDVTDCFNDLLFHTTNLVSECGCNENQYPFHIMLGKAEANSDSIETYNEDKYLSNPGNFKYRHYFVPSPIMGNQFMLFEQVQQLLKRLARIINNFSEDANNFIIDPNNPSNRVKVVPSRDYDDSIGSRAIPYYYNNANGLQRVWNYESTRRNAIDVHTGYHLAANPRDLLSNDLAKNNFNLPFTVATVSVQSQHDLKNLCSFPDLQEQFNYYRDRVLGYLRQWFDSLSMMINEAKKVNDVDKIKAYSIILEEIENIQKRLFSVRCLEKFNYVEYKTSYVKIFETGLLKISKLTNQINSLINVLNIIFFKPIYKIWYAYQYRKALLSAPKDNSLKELAAKFSGLEHLAGVRRGETFLMVYDKIQDKIIADFNIPDYNDCCTDCKVPKCNNSHESKVSPLQKPVIMVVDLTSSQHYSNEVASYDPNNEIYWLELDSMGFYKADSVIKEMTIKPKKEKEVSGVLKGIYTTIGETNGGEIFRLYYKPPPEKVRYGLHEFNYTLEGDFEQSPVTGLILLNVISSPEAKDIIMEAQVGQKPKPSIVYNKENYASGALTMRFSDESRTQIVGGETKYTSLLGNELIIKDKESYPYFILNPKAPGAEQVQYELEANGRVAKGTITMNILSKSVRPDARKYTIRVQNPEGVPVKDVRVLIGRKVVATTDENGDFTLKGVKDGTLLQVEKEGLSNLVIQANSKMTTSIKMEPKPLPDVKDIAEKIPTELTELTKSLGLPSINKIMSLANILKK